MRQITIEEFLQGEIRPFLITYGEWQGTARRTERVCFSKLRFNEEVQEWRKRNPEKAFLLIEEER